MAAVAALDRRLAWAQRCRIPAFLDLRRKIKRHYDAIIAAIAVQRSRHLAETAELTNKATQLTKTAPTLPGAPPPLMFKHPDPAR
ncbi:hypothetical protein ABZW30_12030 [Kitasatospora sp. NPDC004669]|uniref:hypothetical protein n=1 Tax=Kitasatospora sp. NPDC004669 TaxID=3154555 RepID=UPI0033A5F484